MPYRRVTYLKNSFYHVFSRGNRRAAIFSEKRDYQRFLEKMEEYRQKHKIDILAFCLLHNHLHLLVRQLSTRPLSKFMSALLSSHSHYFSLKHSLPPGQFYQGRFGVRLIESEADLLSVSRYVHLNPIKEKILSLDISYRKGRDIYKKEFIHPLRNYAWGSYQFYLDPKKEAPVKINQKYLLEIEKNSQHYRRFVESKVTDEDVLNLEEFQI